MLSSIGNALVAVSDNSATDRPEQGFALVLR
jgi:hypothetical protein